MPRIVTGEPTTSVRLLKQAFNVVHSGCLLPLQCLQDVLSANAPTRWL